MTALLSEFESETAAIRAIVDAVRESKVVELSPDLLAIRRSFPWRKRRGPPQTVTRVHLSPNLDLSGHSRIRVVGAPTSDQMDHFSALLEQSQVLLIPNFLVAFFKIL